nr:VCBS repeat-containing protein [Granulicella sibirica]
MASAPLPTSTLLLVEANGADVTRVPRKTAVQLVAQVQSPTAALTTGRVRFCDASLSVCNDLHQLGVAQLTSSGAATLTIVPGIGVRSYRAEFLGIAKEYQSSLSSAQTLTVTGKFPTTTTLAATGNPGDYTLNATVVGSGSTASLSGTVTFTDLGANNESLGSSAIGSSTPGLSLAVASGSTNLPAPSALGDFNGDGIPDLAGAESTDSIAILLGDGAGGFLATRTSIPVGYNVGQFAVGDFNGDGFQDIAAVSYTDAKLVIVLGKGDGTFQSPMVLPGALYANTIVVGDFNRDGIADLATTNNGVSAVTLYIGRGDGTFNKKSTPLAGASVNMALADFNGDGIEDIAAIEASSVEVLLGNANGTFTSASNTAVGADPFQVIAGDFNNDGVPDLATVSPTEYSVSILLGQGSGAFTASPDIAFDSSTQPYAIALTDLNQDEIEDIAVATASSVEGQAYASVLFGTGQGTFVSTDLPIPGRIFEGASEYFILSADMNGDGNPDLILGPGVLLDKVTETAQASLSGVSISGSGTHSVQAASALSSPYNSSTSGTLGLQAQ